MLSGRLREDLVNLAGMVRFHSKVVWIIGGDGPTYGLSASFTAVQAEVCTLLRAEGHVVWTGAQMVLDLAPWPHRRTSNRLDKLHFEGTTKPWRLCSSTC